MFNKSYPEGIDKLISHLAIKDETFLQICDSRIKEFFRLWNDRKQGDNLPRRVDFEPEEMITLLPFIFMVDIEDQTGEYKYRLVGSNEVLLRGTDPTGKLVKEYCAAHRAEDALKNYDYVFQQKSHLFEISDLGKSHSIRIKDQSLLLPTSSNGRHVDIVIGIAVQDEIQALSSWKR
jgi:hypothetical protein